MKSKIDYAIAAEPSLMRSVMEKSLASFAPYAYALLRIIAGLLFISHGGQKLFGWFGGQPVPFASLFGVAAMIELGLGVLITIGLLTRIAAIIASGEMAVAYFIGHYPKSFWPLENEGEPAVLFCFIFLFMATEGSGIWSVDEARR
jgi:putative oxidoreductase